MVKVKIPPFSKESILIVLLGSCFDDVERKAAFLSQVKKVRWSEGPEDAKNYHLKFVQPAELDQAAVGEYSVSDVYQVCLDARRQFWTRIVFLDDLSLRQGMACPRFGEQSELSCISTMSRYDNRETADQIGHHSVVSHSFDIRRISLSAALPRCRIKMAPVWSPRPQLDFVNEREEAFEQIHQLSILRDPHVTPFSNKKAIFPSTSYIYKLLSRVNPPLPFDVVAQISRQMMTDDSINALTEAVETPPTHDYDPGTLDIIALARMSDAGAQATQCVLDMFKYGDLDTIQVRLHRWKQAFPASRRDMSRIFDWYKSIRRPQHKSKSLHMAVFIEKPLMDGFDIVSGELIWGLSQGTHWPDIFRRGTLAECMTTWAAMCEPSYKDSLIDKAFKATEGRRTEVLWQPWQSFPRAYEMWHRPNFGETADWYTMLNWYFLFLLDDQEPDDQWQAFTKELYALGYDEPGLHEIFYAKEGIRQRYSSRFLGDTSTSKTFNIVRLPTSRDPKVKQMCDVLKKSNQKALLFADKSCILKKEVYWVCNENFNRSGDFSMVYTRIPAIDAYFCMIRSQRAWDRGLTTWANLHREQKVFEYDAALGQSFQIEWTDETEESEDEDEDSADLEEESFDDGSDAEDETEGSRSEEEESDEESEEDFAEAYETTQSAMQVVMTVMNAEIGTASYVP